MTGEVLLQLWNNATDGDAIVRNFRRRFWGDGTAGATPFSFCRMKYKKIGPDLVITNRIGCSVWQQEEATAPCSVACVPDSPYLVITARKFRQLFDTELPPPVMIFRAWESKPMKPLWVSMESLRALRPDC